MFRKFLIGVVGLSLATSAFAELDPELATANNKNEAGLFLGGGLLLGQTYKTGGSSPGVAALVLVEPGWTSRRDSWNRFEASLELGAGQLNFRKDGSSDPKVTMPVKGMMLAKFGYGWSLGDSLFSLVKVGVGPAIAGYEEKADGATTKSDGDLIGLVGMLSYDLVMPMNSWFDITGGVRIMHMAYDLDDVKVDGKKASVDEQVNLNIPAMTVGMRMTF
jgi:hypothetical protein